MKFVCFAYGDQRKMEALSKAQFEAMLAQCKVHDGELRASGKLVSATSLEWTAKTIRPRKGRPTVTDGPFIEAKEVVGGLVIIEAENLEEAVKIASLHPAAHIGDGVGWGIEVRPVAESCHQ